MENLLKKIQEQVGITEEQALKVVTLIKDEFEKGDIDIDWNKFMKGKYDDFLGKAKEALSDASGEASNFADKVSNKADDLAGTAKSKLKEFADKASQYLDDDKDKNPKT